jgi:membrane-associated phospholipid phosphatase
MNQKKEKVSNRKETDIFIRLPSLILSSPLVTLITTVLIIQRVTNIGLIISSIFFYVLLPIITYFYLYKRGLITDEKFDFNIRKREERPRYNIIMITGLLINFLLLSMYNIPVVYEISLFLLLSFVVFTLITFFWKISGHMTQTVLLILILAFVFPNISIYIILIGYLILVPLVGLSRVRLKHHDIWQVLAGTLVTTLVGILVFTIL